MSTEALPRAADTTHASGEEGLVASSLAMPQAASQGAAPSHLPVCAYVHALGGIIDCVEGQVVRVEEHGVDGMPGYYRRVIVTCPWHTGHGQQPCRLRRNTGHRQTAALGMKEPLAYLGAWLVAGSNFSSREDHARFKPSATQTREYATSRNML